MFHKIVLSILITLLFLPRFVLAEVPVIPAGTLLPGTQPVVQQEIKKSGSQSWFQNIFAGNLINLFVGFVSLLAVFFLVISGYQYLTAFGNDDQLKKAKRNIIWSLSGVAIVLLAFTVVQIIINIRLDVEETNKISSAPKAALSEDKGATSAITGATQTPGAAPAGDFCGKVQAAKVQVPTACAAGDAACNTAALKVLIDLCQDFNIADCSIVAIKAALPAFSSVGCDQANTYYDTCVAKALQDFCSNISSLDSHDKAQKAADEVSKEHNLESGQGVEVTLITPKGDNQYEIECQYGGKTSTVTMDGLEDTAKACANKALGCSADIPVKLTDYRDTTFTLRNEDCKSYLSTNGTQLWIPYAILKGDTTLDGSGTLQTFASTILKDSNKVSERSGGFTNGCPNAGRQTNYKGGVVDNEFIGTFQLVNGICSFKTGDVVTAAGVVIQSYQNGVVVASEGDQTGQ